ncbi:hypothetical protein [Kribbia dieselivorans]|uniref:hypothetical protein n=1 Tax=Kribbia dieselivorans TaxID=331526 RepID=UPI0008396989|nr:hypothetical protein [Kribbia dieselivorans]
MLGAPWLKTFGAPRLKAATVCLVAALALSGCASDSQAEALPPSSAARPSTPPPTPVEPVTSAPLEFRTINGAHFTLSVPGGWREVVTKPTEGTPGTWVYTQRSAPAATPIGVGIVVDDQPKADVFQQSMALEIAKKVEEVKDFTRSEITWPGAEYAVVMEWTEPTAGTKPVYRRTRQIMAQVNPGLIVNAVAVGEAKDFKDSDLLLALSTFTPK